MVFLGELLVGVVDCAYDVDHVDGESNGTSTVAEPAGDRLTDPPGRVRGELEALPPVELLYGADEAQVAFLDEVEEVETASCVTLGDGDDEAQVAADEGEFRFLAFFHQAGESGPLVVVEGGAGVETCLGATAPFDRPGQPDLVLGGQQIVVCDLVEVEANGIRHRCSGPAVRSHLITSIPLGGNAITGRFPSQWQYLEAAPRGKVADRYPCRRCLDPDSFGCSSSSPSCGPR